MPLPAAREKYPPIWTIYWNPRDYPGLFVIRLWYGMTPDPQAFTADTPEPLRVIAHRAGASHCLGREPGDDPCIVESWI
jgi:hypothetical protein